MPMRTIAWVRCTGNRTALTRRSASSKRCLRIKPDHAHAHRLLGYVYEQQGRLDEAIQEYQETLRINPDHAHVHRLLGYVCRRPE